MKFLSARDLRNRPGKIREMVKEDDLVLTANGKPLAIIVGLVDGDLERTAETLRRARAQLAVNSMRRAARIAGSDGLIGAEVDAEVRVARAARRKGRRR